MELYRSVLNKREKIARGRAMLVGISGIDASGKGYISSRLASDLESAGYRVALINVDGWLNLPHVRFISGVPVATPVSQRLGHAVIIEPTDAGRHFYHHALRLEEMFHKLVLPLTRDREIDLTMDFAEETATEFRPYTYRLAEIDIVILEGIFIFKREYVSCFDLKIWIDCSFETALERAIGRAQEGLSAESTIDAYQTIYFPAERLHFEIDRPVEAADIVYSNDSKVSNLSISGR